VPGGQKVGKVLETGQYAPVGQFAAEVAPYSQYEPIVHVLQVVYKVVS